jgi:hypothetical protein
MGFAFGDAGEATLTRKEVQVREVDILHFHRA